MFRITSVYHGFCTFPTYIRSLSLYSVLILLKTLCNNLLPMKAHFSYASILYSDLIYRTKDLMLQFMANEYPCFITSILYAVPISVTKDLV